jgi:HEAT repeat protein
VLALLLALAVAQAAPAAAPAASPEVRGEVAALLGAIERPVSPEAFRRLGPEGEAALAEIALSGELPPRRTRALEVLAALRSARAEEVHRAVADSADAPRTTRRAAVAGLGRLVPPERAAAALSPYLERDRDPRVRAAAAEALSQAAPATACAAVRSQAAKEDEAGAARFRRALAACDRARGR